LAQKLKRQKMRPEGLSTLAEALAAKNILPETA
jgi:hypothetical protein